MEPRETKTASAASTLQDAHKKLSNILQHSLSDYAKKMLWDEKGEITPVKESDPTPVQLGKHCLLALQEAERAALGASEVMDRYQRGGITGVVLGEISGIAPFVAAVGKPQPVTDEEKTTAEKEMQTLHKERKAQGVDVYYAAQQLSSHAKAIAKIASEAKLPKETMTQLTSATQAFTHFSPQTLLSSQFPNLSDTFSSLMTTYFSANRPAAPVIPEQKYQSKKDIECLIVGRTPLNYKQFKPNSYLLIKENNKNWKVIYLNDKGKEYPVNINRMHKLKEILGKKPTSAISQEDVQVIKANLASRWNPSAQEREEWFVLVEPLRSALSGTQKLHELFQNFTDDAKARGIKLDPVQAELLERTCTALQNSTIDDGYYQYLDTDQETPLSQSLKGIFNVIWAINQLSKGYWENPGSAAHLQLIKHAKTALDHYWKIQWPGMGKNFGAIGDQLINAMLVYGKDMAFGQLEQFAQSTHDIEFQQHLRFGVLLESIRPVFDGLESVYQERNLGVLTNPFGYSEKTKKILEDKLSTAKKEETDAKEELNSFTTIMKKLEWYRDFAKKIIQPYPSGSRYETLPITETLEKTAQDLLLDLLKLKQTGDFDASDLAAAIDNLEDRLLADLSLDNKKALLEGMLSGQEKDAHLDSLLEKVYKSINQNEKHLKEEKSKNYLQRTRAAVSSLITLHPQTPWPQAEFDLIIKKINDLRKEPKEKLLNVAKYTEALEQHKKMQKEFAIRSLKNTGLIALIEAVRQAPTDDKINLAQKRKLATLLADIRGEDRSDYLTNKRAPEVTATFANSPAEISTFIQQVHAIDPALGHALAMEATLANYTSTVPDSILQSNDPVILRQDLMNALERLEAKQILAMLSHAKNQKIPKPLAIFITLLDPRAPGALTKEALSALEKNIFATHNELTKESFIDILVGYYFEHTNPSTGKPRPDHEIMNKIGLLLGRLAHADAAMAQAIFKNPDGRTILKQECLLQKTSGPVRPDPALYFEALVNTFSFDYKNERHEQEDREFTEFLKANKNIVLEIYKALHPDTPLSDEKIIALYTENNGQNKLMELIETFTKTCLSPGSQAEMQLRQFFSAMLLCKDNTLLRDTLLELQREAHGSKHTQYLELLTAEASYPFWNQVKEDLIVKPQAELFKQFDLAADEIKKQILNSDMSKDEKKEFNQKVEKFITDKKAEVRDATEKLTADGALKAALHLPTSKKDVPLECRQAAQEISKAKKAVETQQSAWTIEIQVRNANQANLQNLDKQLADIEGILDHYLGERSSKSAAFNALLGFELQNKKREIVLDYKKQFSDLRSEVKSSAQSYTDLAKKALDLGIKLQSAHEEALLKHSTNAEQKNKHGGSLGKAITTTQKILKHQPITDDLQKPLSAIARIIATIRSSLTKGASLFGKSQNKIISADKKKSTLHGHSAQGTLSKKSIHPKANPTPSKNPEREASEKKEKPSGRNPALS